MVCSRMVDLPMPGSPPISTTEPSTRPPPSTRSSSAEPDATRGTSTSATSAMVVTLRASPAQPVLAPLPARGPMPRSGLNSVSVFQAPQSVHCPAHLANTLPQSLQTYWVLALAIQVSLWSPYRVDAATPESGLTPASRSIHKSEKEYYRLHYVCADFSDRVRADFRRR